MQAPFEQVENATFIISVPDTYQPFGSTIPSEAIRLKGVFDADPGAGVDWTLQQRVSGSGSLDDMDIASAFEYFERLPAVLAPRPRTPDMTSPFWGPAAVPGIIHSAVLTKDTEGNDRIFAVHSVFPVNPSKPDEGLPEWVVQGT